MILYLLDFGPIAYNFSTASSVAVSPRMHINKVPKCSIIQASMSFQMVTIFV